MRSTTAQLHTPAGAYNMSLEVLDTSEGDDQACTQKPEGVQATIASDSLHEGAAKPSMTYPNLATRTC
jgi:hypothetical protein